MNPSSSHKLYDLEKDLGEANGVSADPSEVLAKMQGFFEGIETVSKTVNPTTSRS